MEAPETPAADLALPTLDLETLGDEGRMQLAIEAILKSPILPNGNRKLLLRDAALLYGVTQTTLADRLKGVRTRQEAHAHQQLLSEAQEEVLVAWVKSWGRRGHPVTQDMLREYASACLTLSKYN